MVGKKGLSSVVTTVLIVLLTIVAIAILWSFLSPLFTGTGGKITNTQNCLDIRLEITKCIATNNEGAVIIKRNSGGGNFSAIKLILYNEDGSSKTLEYNSSQEESETKGYNISSIGFIPKSAAVAAGVLDSKGKVSYCGPTLIFKCTNISLANYKSQSPSNPANPNTPSGGEGNGGTGDTTAPVITNIIKAPDYNSVTISWTTDENANSLVDYGTNPRTEDLTLSNSNSELVIDHQISLSGLFSNTYYYFTITSCDSSNNCDTSPSILAISTKTIATCDDGVKAPDETDVDCGGITCPRCVIGKGCLTLNDCLTGNMCTNGKCAEKTCTDSDSNDTYPAGNNIYLKGTINGLDSDNQPFLGISDSCFNTTSLIEYYCLGKTASSYQVNCPTTKPYCSDGACAVNPEIS